MRRILPILFLATIALPVFAQKERLLEQIRDEEKDAIEAIALYPEKERSMILEASMHPEVLVRLQNMQAKTASDFRGLINYLSEEDQKKVFNISRFPILMYMICDKEKKKTQHQMEEILADYPDDIRADALYLNDNYFGLLVEVNRLYGESDEAFKNALSTYPASIQENYKKLIELPEVMMIMSNNLNMTVLLGDLYRSNPEQIKKELDSLNIVVAEQKAKELNDWKESLENDPEAMAEYEKASQEFASEHGYTESEYSGTLPERYQTDVYIYHVWQPYPYWFGCPWWYTYDCWYPYPWWYHWGFYYGPGNTIVIIGLPSIYYMSWHYHHHNHFYYYPHFTHVIFRYSETHPQNVTTIKTATERWIRDNNDQLPKDWLKNDDKRVERIKEYGKFDIDYQSAIQDGTDKIPSQRDFLNEHSKDYPSLKPVLTEKPDAFNKQEPVNQRNERIQKDPANPVQKPYESKSKVIQQPQTDQQVIERAKTHHENTWERPKPTNPNPVTKPTRTNPVSKPPPQQKPIKKK